jgi:tetratricopeptide (TPR) repeat protein
MSTARVVITTVGIVVLGVGTVIAQPAPSVPLLPSELEESFDFALLMASAEQARAQAEARAESQRARMQAQAEAGEAQVEAARARAEAQAEAARAQVEAARRELRPGFYFHGAGDFEYGRVIHALDRGLYGEALSALMKLSEAQPVPPREEGPDGPRSSAVRPDAITYWMAYAHYKLGEAKDALNALSKLSKTWPDSGWRNDARALEIEIRQSSGQPVRPETIEDEELKILALQGLVRAGRPEAMPALERIVFGVNPPRVKERAMFVLAQTPSPKAREVMVKVIKGGANPDLQVVAVRHLAAFGPESEDLLTDAYGSTSDTRVKEAVISQLAARNRANALVSLARKEKDANLKKRIVERLGRMKSKEATDYLLEIVNR